MATYRQKLKLENKCKALINSNKSFTLLMEHEAEYILELIKDKREI